jgi:RNA polymerase sigma factor for flagellar operon FliA
MATQILTPGINYHRNFSIIPPRFPKPTKPAKLRKICTQVTRPPVCAEIPMESERDRKVIALLPLLNRVARKMRASLPSHIQVDDLVSAGALGLVDAVDKFDPRRQVKIETYAQHRIRGAILDSLRSMDGATRDLRKKNRKAEEVHRVLESRLGHPASDTEMARAQGTSLKNWYRTVEEIKPLGVEWLRPMGWVGVKPVTEETLVDKNAENQFQSCYCREQKEILARALGSLSQRERNIICLYYARERTMKQIGSQLRIDESRVSQLHSAALRRLRNAVKALTHAPRAANSPSRCGQLAA